MLKSDFDIFPFITYKLVTISTVQKYIDVDRRTIINNINNGYLKAVKRNGKWLIDTDSLRYFYSDDSNLDNILCDLGVI